MSNYEIAHSLIIYCFATDDSQLRIEKINAIFYFELKYNSEASIYLSFAIFAFIINRTWISTSTKTKIIIDY